MIIELYVGGIKHHDVNNGITSVNQMIDNVKIMDGVLILL